MISISGEVWVEGVFSPRVRNILHNSHEKEGREEFPKWHFASKSSSWCSFGMLLLQKSGLWLDDPLSRHVHSRLSAKHQRHRHPSLANISFRISQVSNEWKSHHLRLEAEKRTERKFQRLLVECYSSLRNFLLSSLPFCDDACFN